MENSKIEWTDHTFNGWIGCTHVSPACAHCYAEQRFDKHFGKVKWGKGQKRLRTSVKNWNEPLKWDRKAKEKGVIEKVFSNSLSDWADPEVPDEWRHDLFDLIDQTNNLTWLLLTKHPENASRFIYEYLSEFTPDSGIARSHESFIKKIWVGVTVENQKAANERIPILLQIPSAKLFLSIEPMLEEIKIFNLLTDETCYYCGNNDGQVGRCYCGMSTESKIHWVICGGESGAKARPINPEWVRSLRNQCFDAGIPFFFKQWGEYAPMKVNNKLPGEPNNIIETMVRVGKKNAGRLLDGIECNEVPV